jgi:glycogen debranching enzyme
VAVRPYTRRPRQGTLTVAQASLAEGARAVLRRNRVAGRTPDGTEFRFHCPDAHKYPAQFGWDSCWHAIALARLDPAAARDELRTLLRAQRADGFLPHTIFWHRPVRASRRWIYAIHDASERATHTIQPPLEAFAWERVAAVSPDEPGFAGEALAALRARHDWLERERVADDSGLLCLISPDESGLDASPKFDAVMGWRRAPRPGFLLHVHRLRQDGFSLRRVLRRGGFCVQEVLVNTAHALSLRALSRLSGDASLLARAERVERALIDRLWDGRAGLFYDRALPAGQSLAVSTWASLAPLALPSLPRELAERLVAHLRDPRAYALPWPVPSTAACEPAFRRRTGRLLPAYWRGSTWIATNWLLHYGLLQHGYLEDADRLAARTVELVGRSGFREYYDPVDAAPAGARAFGMSTLALDLECQLLERGR